jgi:hypothetical protein
MTLAMTVSVPVALGATVPDNITGVLAPLAKAPMLHVTVCPATLQPAGETTPVTSTGKVTMSVPPDDWEGPALAAVTV